MLAAENFWYTENNVKGICKQLSRKLFSSIVNLTVRIQRKIFCFYLTNCESTKYIITKKYLISRWIVPRYLHVWTINVYIAFFQSVIVRCCYSLKKRNTLSQITRVQVLFMCLIWLPNHLKHIIRRRKSFNLFKFNSLDNYNEYEIASA